MNTRTASLLILFIFGGFILFRAIWPPSPDDNTANLLLNLSIELVGGILLLGLLNLLQNIRHLKLYVMTRIVYRRTDIRMSMAYLFRIQVNGKYLLVKNSRHDYFQPVGGVYKTLPGSEEIFKTLNIRPDRIIETQHGIAKGDLRVYVIGRNVLEFLEWFESKRDREISPWREFCEELIQEDVLPWKEFRYIDYKLAGRVQSPFIDLDQGGKGMFIFDVYDLVINDEQRPILENLVLTGGTDKFIWVNEYFIDRLGHDENTKCHVYKIAAHTKHAHYLKWH